MATGGAGRRREPAKAVLRAAATAEEETDAEGGQGEEVARPSETWRLGKEVARPSETRKW